MKKLPPGVKCATCKTHLHLHHCYECLRVYCWQCERDDFCAACKQREADEAAAGVKRLPGVRQLPALPHDE